MKPTPLIIVCAVLLRAGIVLAQTHDARRAEGVLRGVSSPAIEIDLAPIRYASGDSAEACFRNLIEQTLRRTPLDGLEIDADSFEAQPVASIRALSGKRTFQISGTDPATHQHYSFWGYGASYLTHGKYECHFSYYNLPGILKKRVAFLVRDRLNQTRLVGRMPWYNHIDCGLLHPCP